VKVGDIIQVYDDGARHNWHLAVIEELIVGNDGCKNQDKHRDHESPYC